MRWLSILFPGSTRLIYWSTMSRTLNYGFLQQTQSFLLTRRKKAKCNCWQLMQFHRQDIVKGIWNMKHEIWNMKCEMWNINTKTAALPRLCIIDSTTQSTRLPIPKYINNPTTSVGMSSMLEVKEVLKPL